MPLTPLNHDDSPSTIAAPNRRYGIQIAGVSILLPEGVSAELLHDMSIARMLLAPSYLRGVINLRGALLPVFDLAHLLGAAMPINTQYVLMLASTDQTLGLLVSGHPQAIHGLQRLESQPAPATLAPYVLSAWQEHDKTWLEIDLFSLFRDLANTPSN